MKIRVTSTSNLITFLKKLKTVDKSVLLELDSKKLFCKVHTPEKSVMKYAGVNIEHIFDGPIDFTDLDCDRIKIGLIDVTRLIDAFKHFRVEEDIFMEIFTANLEGSCVATEVHLLSNSLQIKIRCADLSLLSYVSDDILKMVHAKEDFLSKFKIYNSDFSSVVSLCGLENNSEELLLFKISPKLVEIKGDSFKYKLNVGPGEIESEVNTDSSIYKYQLNYVDIETSDCYVHGNRIIFFSSQSDCSTAIGIIEK
jgi:hypothetical protein